MKKTMTAPFCVFIFLLGCCLPCTAADTLRVCSPSGKICVSIWMGKTLQYRVGYEGQEIMAASSIDMELVKEGALSAANAIRHSEQQKVNQQIVNPVPEKRRIVPDVYTLLSITFRKPFTVEFRVYDDGVAYRIGTRFKDSVFVKKETATFSFPGKPAAYWPEVTPRGDADIFHTSFESEYPLRPLDSLAATVIAYNPILLATPAGPKIAITESDLEEYPGMFLQGTGSSTLTAVFAGYPSREDTVVGTYSAIKVAERAPYIARTTGTRTFPWRVLLIAPQDKDLPGNDLVYRLGAPSRIKETGWIKTGKLTDEWIIDLNLFNVPFRSGLNTASYKYYIDFAKQFGFERIMMDAGWSDNNDLFKITPGIDMDTLAAYAKEKGIGISMWTLSMTLNRQLDSALARFKKWGVDFIMTDFIDRDDQKTMQFYYRVAKACAENQIMIMYHGAFPPKGFNRTWPNAVSREGVLGSEYNIWSNRVTPKHDVTLAYTRMLAGSFDYEPGILHNSTEKGTRPVAGVVTAGGTRCHQLSMFIVYDDPMQIFSGNPSEGVREPEFMHFLGAIPVAWDETVVLDGKVGEYIVTARQKGNDWYVGAMTDWTPRDIAIDFSFLKAGNYKATIVRDGINADRYADDYLIEKDIAVTSNSKLTLHLAPGGGLAIRLIKE